MRFAACLILAGCAGAAEDPPAIAEPHFDFGCPNREALACTGLYGEAGEHWYSKRLGDGVEPFAPGVALWSDHMEKQRFVWLPPNTPIDTRNPDAWLFPVGTKFWKEFSYQGTRIETRYLEKYSYGWDEMTFRWTSDQSSAFSLTQGERQVPGTFRDSYEVPATDDCKRCHAGAKDHILGFSAVVMADTNARGLTVEKLAAAGRLSQPLPNATVPGTAVEQAAVRYLHVNCGLACHNPSFDAEAWWTGFYMNLEVGRLSSIADTAVFKTGVGVDSYVPDVTNTRYLKLLAPGDPEQSAVIFRDTQRDTTWQMPPLATHAVDDAGVAAVKAWLMTMPR